eukprot:scaffold311759_cov31-Tisochrysis_lutea.AAC.3
MAVGGSDATGTPRHKRGCSSMESSLCFADAERKRACSMTRCARAPSAAQGVLATTSSPLGTGTAPTTNASGPPSSRTNSIPGLSPWDLSGFLRRGRVGGSPTSRVWHVERDGSER